MALTEQELEVQRRYRERNRERIRERNRLRARRRWKENREAILASRHRPEARARLKVRQRRYQLKRRYGLTPEALEALLATQAHACAICRRPIDGGHVHVDHDHDTGRVRGLLCQGCNTGIGNLQESVGALLSAAAYLTRSSGGMVSSDVGC